MMGRTKGHSIAGVAVTIVTFVAALGAVQGSHGQRDSAVTTGAVRSMYDSITEISSYISLSFKRADGHYLLPELRRRLTYDAVPTAAPTTPVPTLAPTSIDASLVQNNFGEHQYHAFRWSFVFPLLSVSFVAWAVRKNTKRCIVCCVDTASGCEEAIVKGDIPDEIVFQNKQGVEDNGGHDNGSVVGDKDDDIELRPVSEWLPPAGKRKAHAETERLPFGSTDANLPTNWSEDGSDYKLMEV